ncbi:hypothetical protein NY486_17825, partial [Enterobacter hormaechei]|nr:hypothetical protein [Enterobacter hormaechei]
KPRARLGPTEIVQLRDPHDSEDEDDEDKAPEGEARDDDFLADYPDDTEVGAERARSGRDDDARLGHPVCWRVPLSRRRRPSRRS